MSDVERKGLRSNLRAVVDLGEPVAYTAKKIKEANWDADKGVVTTPIPKELSAVTDLYPKDWFGADLIRGIPGSKLREAPLAGPIIRYGENVANGDPVGAAVEAFNSLTSFSPDKRKLYTGLKGLVANSPVFASAPALLAGTAGSVANEYKNRGDDGLYGAFKALAESKWLKE